MDELRKVVQHLAGQDLRFYAVHDDPGGQAKVHLEPDEVVSYSMDPAAFFAAHYGVTKDVYLAWHESNFNVICSAKTLKGRQCKAVVAGCGHMYSPKVWNSYRGEYCITHGGPTAGELRARAKNGAN